MHTWESRCIKCAIERKYEESLKDCPQIDCSDRSVVDAAYYVVAGDHNKACTPANFAYAFEWGGSFDTPDSSYKWVAQAVDGAYADPAMKLALFTMTETGMGSLFMMQVAADTLIATGDCSTVVNAGGSIPKPTADGVCVTLTFPTNPATDFYATIDTDGVAHTAFFAEHVPIEFERDIHYLMEATADADLGTTATPNEPIAQVPASGGGHAHMRQLSSMPKTKQLSHLAAERAFAKGPRRGRSLADAGSCCTTAPQQGAWKQIVSYHDLCDHDDVPTFVEVGFHDYEAACENYFCNAVPSDYDGTVCPSPPAPPVASLEIGAVVGIVAACAVVILLLGFGMFYLIQKEKAGKPIFTSINSPVKGANKAVA